MAPMSYTLQLYCTHGTGVSSFTKLPDDRQGKRAKGDVTLGCRDVCKMHKVLHAKRVARSTMMTCHALLFIHWAFNNHTPTETSVAHQDCTHLARDATASGSLSRMSGDDIQDRIDAFFDGESCSMHRAHFVLNVCHRSTVCVFCCALSFSS